jgi:hypothetical protein
MYTRRDVNTALGIQAEYVCKHAPIPPPRFFEVSLGESGFDDLWHVPLAARTKFSRVLDIPALVTFERPDWRLTALGIVPQRRDKFWLANLVLQPPTTDPDLKFKLGRLKIPQVDYFPSRGDLVYYNGHRYIILNVVIEPNAYWHQTNVWLGLIVECQIAMDGDARPVQNPGVAAPSEKPGTELLPEP